MALATGTRLGPYEIVALVGSGGMGEVYKATDTRLDRTVAIKVLPQHLAANPELRQRMEREARAVAALNHPHICALYDVGSQDGIDFLVLEFLEGETLAARIARGPLELGELLRCAVQAADALDKAHRQAFTHRDLKPGNIMLTKAGAKLLDFGLAKTGGGPGGAILPTTPTQSAAALTAAGTVLGTFQYMAPEQLAGRDADARSDIFSFGAVLYEMATGHKAFPGTTQATVIGAILHTEPAPVSPPSLDRAIRVCLAKDADERWQSVKDLKRELEWIAETPAAATPPSEPAVRSRVPWMIAAVVTLAALALAGLYFRRPPAEQRVTRFVVLPPEKATFGDSVVVSPNGRLVAFTAVSDGRTALWIRPLNSLTPQQVAGTEDAILPFWSPDSRFVAFFAGVKLKKVEVSGGPPQTLCDAPPGTGGAWSPEGTIVFVGARQGVLQRVSSAGGAPANLTTFDASRRENSHRWPLFLPDGRHFLYLARSSAIENSGIYAGSLDGKTRKRILSAVSMVGYAEPGAAGKGYLLYVREATLVAQPFDPGRLETTGEPFPVAEKVGTGVITGMAPFSVSPGGVLVYRSVTRGGNAQLTWFDRAGKLLETAGPAGPYFDQSLSPDGKPSPWFWGSRSGHLTCGCSSFRGVVSNGSPLIRASTGSRSGPPTAPASPSAVLGNSRSASFGRLRAGPVRTRVYRPPAPSSLPRTGLPTAVLLYSTKPAGPGTIFGSCPSRATASRSPSFKPSSARGKAACRPTASGWRTCRTSPARSRSTCGTSPDRAESGRSRPAPASSPAGGATARSSSTARSTVS